MLEARTACSGAAGRNGGHTKPAGYRAFMDNVLTGGEAETARTVRFEFRCMKAVHEFARNNDIDCDSWEGDTVDIIYDGREWNKAKKSVSEIKRILGSNDPAARYTIWEEKEIEKKVLSKRGIGGIII